MRAIMISIKPKYCALIMNGDKKGEVRKENVAKAAQKLIDQYGFADFYVCCTKGKQGIFKERHNGYTLLNQNKWIKSEMNGKVLFKFRCYKVEEILSRPTIGVLVRYTNKSAETKLCTETCLTPYDLDDYLGIKKGYDIKISKVKIFDEPMELWQFGVKHSPQSFCYIEVDDK